MTNRRQLVSVCAAVSLALAACGSPKSIEEPLAFPKTRSFRHSMQITEEYDRFKERTDVKVGSAQVIGTGVPWSVEFSEWWASNSKSKGKPPARRREMELSPKADYVGRPDGPHGEPTVVALHIVSSWPDQYSAGGRDPACVFLADRSSVATTLYADASQTSSENERSPSDRSNQYVIVAMSLRDFLRLVSASKVEGRCWGDEFTVREEFLEAWRDFASRLDPAHSGVKR